MLESILDEERRLEREERLARTLLERMDVQHIRPILKHLDEQDHKIEEVAARILAAVQRSASA